MKDIFKKIGVGVWISVAAVVLAVVALIIYGVMLDTGDGVFPQGTQAGVYFYKNEFGSVTTLGVLGLFFIVIAIAGGLFNFEELFAKLNFDGVLAKVFKILGKVCNVIVDALRVVAPVLFMLMIMSMVQIMYNGFAWSLFSNEELAIDPKAVETSYLMIVTAVMLLITSITCMVAAFFGLRKKGNKEVAEKTVEETAEETAAE